MQTIQALCAVATIGTAGLIGTNAVEVQEFSWIKSIAELGSFGLVAFAAIMLLVRGVPLIVKHLDETNKTWAAELAKERDYRERAKDDFRDMLSSHKGDITAKLEEGNKLTRDLISEIKSRPCQK